MSQGPTLEAALLAAGVLDQAAIDKAKAFGQSKGLPLERAILALDLAPEGPVYRAVGTAAGLPFLPEDKLKPTAAVLEKIPVEQVEQNHALPVGMKNGALYVAIDDSLKTYVADNLSFVAGCEVKCVIAAPGALRQAIRKVVSNAEAGASSAAATGRDDDPEGPIIRLVERSISEAVVDRASDIHIEPFENRVIVRYRIDGVLRERRSLERELHGPLISRLKIMAGLDIAEKRKPQDGRIDFRVEGRQIDIRTSILPTNHGESVVMRLLDKEKGLLSLAALGFVGEDHDRFERTIKRPNGVFLVTGPTGSGKTTTLYAALQNLNRPNVKIITAEDPVEFHIAGINQCHVRAPIGLTFARILRAMLRQAPNIILVGEIRDKETAEIAIQAALTGHLVFSTLHTNDAPSAITRLTDIGVKPFLVSAAVQAIMAQRLVRVLCEQCKEEYAPSETELRSIGMDANRVATLYRSRGCDHCEQTGYRGRLGIFEMLIMDNTMRELTFRGESTVRLREYARTGGGMRTLTDDGIRKVLDGKTSLDELLRVTAAV